MSTTEQPLSLASSPAVAQARPARALPKRSRKRRRWLLFLVMFLALLLVVALGGLLFTNLGNDRPLDITGRVTRSSLTIAVTESGELQSARSVDVRCDVEGEHTKLVSLTAEGAHVTAGQEVGRFDSEEKTRLYADQEVKWKQADGKAKATHEELEVAKNKAEGENAKAELALTLADLDLKKYVEGDYKVDLEERKGDIALAKRELDEAKQKLDETRRLVQKGFATLEQLHLQEGVVLNKDYLLKSKAAKLMVLEKFERERKEVEFKAKAVDAKRELERTRRSGAASIAKAQSDLDAAEGTARLEKATLDRLQRQVAQCIIKAPQDGILVYSKERFWDPSSRIQAGAMVHFQQKIFSLPDLSQMEVSVKIHESVVKKVRPGQKAEIQVEAYPDRGLHGTVLKVATLAVSDNWDRAIKEYETIVHIDDLPEGAGLLPGMTAKVTIKASQLDNVLVVPVQAVAEDGTKHIAFVIKGRSVERREVEVGGNNEKFVEIKSGLNEDERVALDARARLAAETKSDAPPPAAASGPKPTTP